MSSDESQLDQWVGAAAELGLSAVGLPVVGSIAGSFASRKIREEHRSRTSRALKAVESVTGRSRENLLEFVESNAEAFPLWQQVLIAAGTNGHDEVLRMMGASFGMAAKAANAGSVEALRDAEAFLRAAQALTPLHVHVLKTTLIARAMHDRDSTDADRNRKFLLPDITSRSNLSDALTSQCLMALATAGLISISSGFGALRYDATEAADAIIRAAALI